MSGVENRVALVLLRRSEKPEHRILRRFEWEEVIVSPIDHQNGHRDSGGEVDLVNFGEFLSRVKTLAGQHKHLDAVFNRRKDVAEICASVEAVVRDRFTIEIFTCLDVIKRSGEVLRPSNDMVTI